MASLSFKDLLDDDLDIKSCLKRVHDCNLNRNEQKRARQEFPFPDKVAIQNFIKPHLTKFPAKLVHLKNSGTHLQKISSDAKFIATINDECSLSIPADNFWPTNCKPSNNVITPTNELKATCQSPRQTVQESIKNVQKVNILSNSLKYSTEIPNLRRELVTNMRVFSNNKQPSDMSNNIRHCSAVHESVDGKNTMNPNLMNNKPSNEPDLLAEKLLGDIHETIMLSNKSREKCNQGILINSSPTDAILSSNVNLDLYSKLLNNSVLMKRLLSETGNNKPLLDELHRLFCYLNENHSGKPSLLCNSNPVSMNSRDQFSSDKCSDTLVHSVEPSPHNGKNISASSPRKNKYFSKKYSSPTLHNTGDEHFSKTCNDSKILSGANYNKINHCSVTMEPTASEQGKAHLDDCSSTADIKCSDIGIENKFNSLNVNSLSNLSKNKNKKTSQLNPLVNSRSQIEQSINKWPVGSVGVADREVLHPTIGNSHAGRPHADDFSPLPDLQNLCKQYLVSGDRASSDYSKCWGIKERRLVRI